MGQKFYSWLLRFLGFQLEMPPKPWPPQYMMIVIPHTSNWDFPLGLIIRRAMGENIRFVGKSSLFRWPFGYLFRWLGGYPVDRSKRTNFVDEVVKVFGEVPDFKMVIAPEGTRSKVTKLKTGFYYIAKGAGVPIMLCAFNWQERKIQVSEPFHPTDDKDADFQHIYQFYKDVQGFHPENSFAPETETDPSL